MDLGQHAIFIWIAYGVTLTVIAALVIYAILAERVQQRALAALEAQGIRRRSDAAASETPKP